MAGERIERQIRNNSGLVVERTFPEVGFSEGGSNGVGRVEILELDKLKVQPRNPSGGALGPVLHPATPSPYTLEGIEISQRRIWLIDKEGKEVRYRYRTNSVGDRLRDILHI